MEGEMRYLFILSLFMFVSISYAEQRVNVKSLDGRSYSFRMNSQQAIRDLKPLVAKKFDIPACNLRLTDKSHEPYADDKKMGEFGKKDVIILHDVSSPFNRSKCQAYDHAPEY
jgi:hypothetical protein